MRISKAGKGLLVLAIFGSQFSSTSLATAEPNTQSSPAPDSFKAQMEQYRLNREIYISVLKQRGAQIKIINSAFKNACDTAAADFKIAMSSAKTPDAKNSAISTRKSAIAAAIAARDASIALLGAEPIAPIEPVKPTKNSKNKNR